MQCQFYNILPDVIENYYGVKVARIELCHEGHSNVVCVVDTAETGDRLVFRIEPPFENTRRFNDFKKISLPDNLPFQVPKFIYEEHLMPVPFSGFSISGYKFIKGKTKYQCYDLPSFSDLSLIVDAYRSITDALAQTPVDKASVGFFERYYYELDMIEKFRDSICDYSINCEFIDKFDAFISRAKSILKRAEILAESLVLQFVHNDFQLGNIVFDGDKISGLLDFEDMVLGYREFDTIFSAFRIAKSNGSETNIDVDIKIFNEFLRLSGDKTLVLYQKESYEFWLSFFALREAIRYMISAVNNVDVMRVGIGFMSCFLQVSNFCIDAPLPLRALMFLNADELPDVDDLKKIESEFSEIIFVQLLESPCYCNNFIIEQRNYLRMHLAKPFYIFPVFKDDIPDFRLKMRIQQLSPSYSTIVSARMHKAIPSADEKKRGVMITRAQPFHKGHLEIIEKVVDKYDEVIIIIACAEESFTDRNPLTAGQRMEIVAKSIQDKPYVDKIWIFPVPCNRFVAENMSELRFLCPDFQSVISTNPVNCRLAEYDGLIYDTPKISCQVRATDIRDKVRNGLSISGMMSNQIAENIFLKYFKS